MTFWLKRWLPLWASLFSHTLIRGWRWAQINNNSHPLKENCKIAIILIWKGDIVTFWPKRWRLLWVSPFFHYFIGRLQLTQIPWKRRLLDTKFKYGLFSWFWKATLLKNKDQSGDASSDWDLITKMTFWLKDDTFRERDHLLLLVYCWPLELDCGPRGPRDLISRKRFEIQGLNKIILN